MRNQFFAIAISLLLTGISPVTTYAAWYQDDNGWRYEYDDRSACTDSWLLDQGIWYHFDKNGYMQTGWLLDGDLWYYLNPSGAMAADTKKIIDNLEYTFNSSGALIHTAASQSQATHGFPKSGSLNGRQFENTWSNYRMTLPAGCTIEEPLYDDFFSHDLKDITFDLTEYYGNVQIVYHDMGQTVTDELLQQYMELYKSKRSPVLSLVNSRNLYLGDYKFRSCEYAIDSHMFWDAYFRPVDNYIMVIQILSYNHLRNDVEQMLGSIRRVQ